MNKKLIQVPLCLMTSLVLVNNFTMDAKASDIRMSQNGSYHMIQMTHGNCVSNLQTTPEEASLRLDALVENGLTTADELSVLEEAAEEEKRQVKTGRTVVAQVGNYVNIRNTPDENGEILGKMKNNDMGELLQMEDGWCKVTSGSVTGYVKADYCVIGMEAEVLKKKIAKRFAQVTADGLYIRKNAGTDEAILGMVAQGEDLVVLEEGMGWIKVDTEEGEGWVSAEYVELRTEYPCAESVEEEKERLEKEKEARKKAREAAAQSMVNTTQNRTTGSFVLDPGSVSIIGDSQMGVEVVRYALQFVGNPYVYGGSSLTTGTDCSGFVMSVYANYGVSLPHSSAADRQEGTQVADLASAQAGDIICYSGHVAIYIGDGKIVHAANQKNGIVVSPADYKDILDIRRIF